MNEEKNELELVVYYTAISLTLNNGEKFMYVFASTDAPTTAPILDKFNQLTQAPHLTIELPHSDGTRCHLGPRNNVLFSSVQPTTSATLEDYKAFINLLYTRGGITDDHLVEVIHGFTKD